MAKRKLITKKGTDPEVFKMIEQAGKLQKIGTPEPNKHELRELLSTLAENEVDFPRTTTSVKFLIELLDTGELETEKVLEKAREVIDRVKEDLGIPIIKQD